MRFDITTHEPLRGRSGIGNRKCSAPLPSLPINNGPDPLPNRIYLKKRAKEEEITCIYGVVYDGGNI